MSGPSRRERRGLMLAVSAGAMLVPLNSTMIAVVLPELVEELDSDVASVTWLVTAYLIAMVVLQPLGGRLGDRLGRGPVFLVGLGGFLAASLAATLAPNLALLIVFRVLQAASGALVVPNGLALVRERTAERRLGSRMGVIGAALTLAAAAGPPLGGGLVALFGWPAIFAVNVPLAALGLVLGVRFVPWRRSSRSRRVPPGRLGRLPAGLLAAAAGIALTNLAMYVTLLSIPLLLDRRGGVGSAEIGLVLGCLPIATAALSPLGGRASDRVGRRIPAIAGAALLAASMLVLSLDPGVDAVGVAALLLVAGAGIGIATPALQTAAMEAVRVAHSGTAAGLSSTSRYLGSITGTLLLAGPLAPAAVGEGGFGVIYAALAGCSAAAMAVALLLPRGRGASGGGPVSAAGADGVPPPVPSGV